MKASLFSLLALAILFTGCVEYYHTVDYFNVKTSPSYKGSTISTPLHIVISDELPDSMSAKDKYSEIELKLTDFRKTIGDNLKQTLGKSFSKVSISQNPDNDALNLVLNNVETRLSSNSFTFNHKRTIRYFVNFKIGFTLYKGEKEINGWNTTTQNAYYATSTVYYTELVKSGVRDICEIISDEILSDPTINQFLAVEQ